MMRESLATRAKGEFMTAEGAAEAARFVHDLATQIGAYFLLPRARDSR